MCKSNPYVSKKQLRISTYTTRPGTASFSACMERNQGPVQRSNTRDCLKMESAPSPLRKSQSTIDLTRSQVSLNPPAARSIAFLWRRPTENQTAIKDSLAVERLAVSSGSTPFEDIKQRWRRQQMATLQKLAAPEKTSFWCMLTRSRLSLPRTTGGQQRTAL